MSVPALPLACPQCSIPPLLGRVTLARHLMDAHLMNATAALKRAQETEAEAEEQAAGERRRWANTPRGEAMAAKSVCAKCGQPYEKTSNRQQFCVPCGKDQKKARDTRRRTVASVATTQNGVAATQNGAAALLRQKIEEELVDRRAEVRVLEAMLSRIGQ